MNNNLQKRSSNFVNLIPIHLSKIFIDVGHFIGTITWIRITRIILRPLSALSLDAKRNITTGLFGLGLGNNNEKLGLPERLSAGIQFRFRNLFHGKIWGNCNFIS